MSDITFGAVGAAIIAGLVSLLGLIIGKEQKISEFRQAWIDNLRKSIAEYLVNVNSISDVVRLRRAGQPIDSASLIASYKSLNQASHTIELCVNAEEVTAKELLATMRKFETLFKDNEDIAPEKIKIIEQEFLL